MLSTSSKKSVYGAAMIAATLALPTAGFAATQIYDVTLQTDLINAATFCGVGGSYYNGCAGNTGMKWNDTLAAGDTITSIAFDFQPGVQCTTATYVFTSTLNGVAAGAPTWSFPAFCACSATPGGAFVSRTLPVASYTKGGLNQWLMTNPVSCQGWQFIPATSPPRYARITVTYTPGTGGGGGSCATPGQASSIEAKLDDGTRFTSDAERATQTSTLQSQIISSTGQVTTTLTTTLLTPINRLETKLDDGSRFTSDAERTAQTTSITTPIAAIEAKFDTVSADQKVTQRLLIENALLNIDRTSILYLPKECGGKLEDVRAIVADVITKNEACGVSTGGAAGDLAQADLQIAAGNWKSAFDSLRAAYRKVVTGG